MHRFLAISIAAFSFVATAQAQSVNGTVTKIDEPQAKLTINHAPIKNLDMDAMTMVFRVKEASMLKGLKAGDKVKFEADRVNGAITVIKIEKAR